MVDTSSTVGSSSSPGEASAPAATAPAAQPDSAAPASPATSWDQAFESAGLTGDPETGTTGDATPTTPAPATTAPESAAPPPETVAAAPATQGPIPFERHKAILDNQRAKTLREVEQRVQQHFGAAIELQEHLRRDAAGTLTGLIDEALDHPEIGAKVLSHVARALANRRGKVAAEVAGAEEPGPDLVAQDPKGGEVRFYSAEQQAKRDAWVRQSILDEVQGKVAPLQQAHEARQRDAAAQQATAALTQQIGQRLALFRDKMPGFKDHEADIQAAQRELVAQGVDTWTALSIAAHSVLSTKRAADTVSTLHAQAARQAAASVGSPTRPVPAGSKGAAKSWDEAFERVGLN